MRNFNKSSFAFGIILLRLSKHLALLLLFLIAGRLSGYSSLDQNYLIALAIVSAITHQFGKIISDRAKMKNPGGS